MEALNLNRSTNKWRKRFNQNHTSNHHLSLSSSPLVLLSSLLCFIEIPCSLIPSPRFEKFLASPCSETLGQEFFQYVPHSGLSKTATSRRNGILMAALLNRTLIVPPILDHHAVALGSCPKFRVLSPNDSSFAFWIHSVDLFGTRRYVSTADTVDLCCSCPIQRLELLNLEHLCLIGVNRAQTPLSSIVSAKMVRVRRPTDSDNEEFTLS